MIAKTMKKNLRIPFLLIGTLFLLSFSPGAKEIEKDSIEKKKTGTVETAKKISEVTSQVSTNDDMKTSVESKPGSASSIQGSYDKLLMEYGNLTVQDSVKLNWYVFPGGISMGTGSGIQLSAVTGQEFIGTYTSSEYHLNLGFFQSFEPASCCVGYRGNVREDSIDDGTPYSLNVADLVRLAAFMLAGDPPPPCLAEADIDGSGQIDIADVIHLVDFMFRDGPLPSVCP